MGGVSSEADFYASVAGRQSAKCAQQAVARTENSPKPLSTGTAVCAVCLPASSTGKEVVEVAKPGAESSSKLTHRRHSIVPVPRVEKTDRKGRQTRRHSMHLGMVVTTLSRSGGARSSGAAFYSNVIQLKFQPKNGVTPKLPSEVAQCL